MKNTNALPVLTINFHHCPSQWSLFDLILDLNLFLSPNFPLRFLERETKKKNIIKQINPLILGKRKTHVYKKDPKCSFLSQPRRLKPRDQGSHCVRTAGPQGRAADPALKVVGPAAMFPAITEPRGGLLNSLLHIIPYPCTDL